MSYYIALPLLLLLALIEAAVLPLFRVSGLQPNLVLVLLVAWLMVRGEREASVLVPFGGLFLGIVDGAPLGTALVALAPLAILQEVRGSQLSEGGLLMAIVFTVVMTLGYHMAYLVVYSIQGEAGSWLQAIVRVFVPTAFLNVVVLLPFYALMSFFSHQRRVAYA